MKEGYDRQYRSGSMTGRIVAAFVVLTAASCEEAGSANHCPAQQIASMAVVTERGLPIVEAAIRGRPAVFIIDTGDQISTIAGSAADRLDLEVGIEGRYRINGINGSFVAPATVVNRLLLGKAVIYHVRFAVAGDYGPARDGVVVDGLLGSDLLSRYDVDFNLPSNRIDLYEKSKCTPFPPLARRDKDGLPFHWEDDYQVRLPIRLNGYTADALLDSGAQHTTLTDDILAAAHVRRNSGFGHAVLASGIDGHPVRLHLFSMPSLQVGPVRQQPVEVMVADLPSALIGADFLRSHRVWISYSLSRVFIADAPEGAIQH